MDRQVLSVARKVRVGWIGRLVQYSAKRRSECRMNWQNSEFRTQQGEISGEWIDRFCQDSARRRNECHMDKQAGLVLSKEK